MRIITWNCNGAFRRKFQHLLQFDADIIIVQECEDPSQASDKKYRQWASNFIWVGENKNKGLGVFAKPTIELQPLKWPDDGLKYFIPCSVNGEFTLLSTWCHGANSPTFRYIGQMWKYLQLHKDNLGQCFIGGDFNSNTIWDKWDRWWNHSDVVRELFEIDVVSVYHHLNNEVQGKETRPTFYLQKNPDKPYHIDYFFAHLDYLPTIMNLSIGEPDNWL